MFSINLDKYPILDIGQRCGDTDYIDFIKYDEVTEPVMHGVDKFNRKFVVIKFLVDNKHKLMQTFFQRYTDGYGWMGCGHATINLLDTTGNMDRKEYQSIFLQQIINGETVKLNENHRPTQCEWINKNVTLYDEKKINATITIQKYWRICRYNPKYKMCHIVQHNNLIQIYDNYNHFI
jgi:hypothetical protein